MGWALGYRRGQRAAWEVALRAAGPTEEEKAAAAAAMKNKATRWAKTGEQLRAARVGEKRTKIPKRRRVDMVDWPEPSQGPKDKERRGSRSATLEAPHAEAHSSRSVAALALEKTTSADSHPRVAHI